MKINIKRLLLLSVIMIFPLKDSLASEVIGLDNDELQNAPNNEVRTLQLNQVNQGACSERLDPNGGSCFESVSCIFRCKIKNPAYDGECKSGPHWLLKCYCNTPCPTQPPPTDHTFNPPLSAPVNPTPDGGKANGGDKKKHRPPHSAPEDTPSGDAPEDTPSGDAPEDTPSGDAPDNPPHEDDLAPESGEDKDRIKKKPPPDSSPTIPVNPHPTGPVNPSPNVPAIPPPTIPIISPPGLPAGSPPPFCSARYDPSDTLCVSSAWCAVKCKVDGPTYGGECKSGTHMLTRCYCNFPCTAQQPPTAPV